MYVHSSHLAYCICKVSCFRILCLLNGQIGLMQYKYNLLYGKSKHNCNHDIITYELGYDKSTLIALTYIALYEIDDVISSVNDVESWQ